MQFHPKGARHVEQRRKTWITVRAQRAIETFADEAGIFGNLRHAFCARDFAKCPGNTERIVEGFIELGILIRRHLFWRAQLFRDIVRNRFGSEKLPCSGFDFCLGHEGSVLKVFCQPDCQIDVLLLA